MPGQAPSLVNTSLWQTPQACTLMRTCPAVGLGISRSTISKSAPALGTCAAFMGAIPILVVAMISPLSSLDVTSRRCSLVEIDSSPRQWVSHLMRSAAATTGSDAFMSAVLLDRCITASQRLAPLGGAGGGFKWWGDISLGIALQ